mmetsp:Transcript_26875/g.79787  ORF Transcript_26875/g.79787 Transcript_26875/m.79787 type:complete len:147 (-) Transcript_26875:1669-2109(-)
MQATLRKAPVVGNRPHRGSRPYRGAVRQQGSRSLVAARVIKHVNAEQLTQEIEDRKTTLIIDFYATWCGPCKLMEDELKKVDDVLGDEITILKVDTEAPQNKDLSRDLQIEGLPTVVLIPVMEGKEGLRMEGVIKAQELMETISEM